MDPKTTQISLMLNQALERMHDAHILSRNVTLCGDSNYLLELLAFELLLKSVVLIHAKTDLRSYKHNYSDIFNLLPTETRNRIVKNAQERMTNLVDYNDMRALLERFSKNFIDLRYPYERYTGLTDEEYRARGCDWVSKGMPENEADFVYKPHELFGLLEALKIEVETWLSR